MMFISCSSMKTGRIFLLTVLIDIVTVAAANIEEASGDDEGVEEEASGDNEEG